AAKAHSRPTVGMRLRRFRPAEYHPGASPTGDLTIDHGRSVSLRVCLGRQGQHGVWTPDPWRRRLDLLERRNRPAQRLQELAVFVKAVGPAELDAEGGADPDLAEWHRARRRLGSRLWSGPSGGGGRRQFLVRHRQREGAGAALHKVIVPIAELRLEAH